MKNLLGDFDVKVGKEDISKQISGNENLLEISNNNGVRVANFAYPKIRLPDTNRKNNN
jgi:hypothetical protein